MADVEFDRVGWIRCIAKTLEGGNGGRKLYRRNQKIDIGKVAGTYVRIDACQDVGETFERHRLDAQEIEGGRDLLGLIEGGAVTVGV